MAVRLGMLSHPTLTGISGRNGRESVMLSDTSLPVIKATLPVVGEHIQEIAQRFYKHMFDARPDLLDGLFNRGNQADGRQQQALAGSIAAFAGMLVDKPDEVPDHLLSRVAHKHVSLGLSPDQYQIVHDHLFWAIVDVLGDAVTPEVAAAWDEVYWLMGNMLINKERGLYNAVHLSPETIWRTWRVAQRIQETEDVVTFVVERTDERDVKPSLPGQYVTIKMAMPDGVQQPRQYSLTRADDGLHRQFAVKRVHGLQHPGRRDVHAAPQRCPGGRRGGALGPLRRRGAGVHGPARWSWPAPASGSRRWPECCPTS